MPRNDRPNRARISAGESSRSRGWCFTIFSLDRDTVPTFPDCDYSIAGRETAPDTGRFHWQAYAHWPTLRSFEQTKELFPGAHIEKAKGSPQQNRVYCSKGGDFEETGTAPRQGGRSDLISLCAMLSAGATPATIARIHPGHVLRLHGRFQGYLDAIAQPPRSREVDVQVYWGVTGSGKTRKVIDNNPDVFLVPHWDGKTIWFDGYRGQDAILFDDFDGSLDFRLLLHVTDWYTRQYPVKGAFIVSRWTKVFITSDRHPRDWYTRVENYPQLERRISRIRHFVGNL